MIDIKSYLENQFEGQKGVQYGSDINWQRSINHINSIIKYIPQNAKVLDIGCGHGHHLYILKQLRNDIDIVGIDIKSQKIWETLKNEGFNLQIMSGEKMYFENNYFDTIVSFGVMEHVNDDNLFLKEINRVLKDNGNIFIFNLPNKYSFTEWLAGIIGIINHKVRYDINKIKKIFDENNFIIQYKREFLLPAQYNHINISLNKFFNKYTKLIIHLDNILCSSPLNIFAQSYYIHGEKKSWMKK